MPKTSSKQNKAAKQKITSIKDDVKRTALAKSAKAKMEPLKKPVKIKKAEKTKTAASSTFKRLQQGATLSDSETLRELIIQAESELKELQPKIDRLEKQLARFNELQEARQKLLTFKLSLEAILSSYTASSDVSLDGDNRRLKTNAYPFPYNVTSSQRSQVAPLLPMSPWDGPEANDIFDADVAIEKTGLYLRRKNSINYHIFKAVIANGGRVNTHDVKRYLIEHNIQQPGSGDSFETVPLTDISSRVNYLVRKGLLISGGQGAFVARFGWHSSEKPSEMSSGVPSASSFVRSPAVTD